MDFGNGVVLLLCILFFLTWSGREGVDPFISSKRFYPLSPLSPLPTPDRGGGFRNDVGKASFHRPPGPHADLFPAASHSSRGNDPGMDSGESRHGDNKALFPAASHDSRGDDPGMDSGESGHNANNAFFSVDQA